MELIVFDLDGTLLNAGSAISSYTADTLLLLSQQNIAYTVATGRTMHAAKDVLTDQGFELPQIYKNGVMIWHPEPSEFSHRKVLTGDELGEVTRACESQGITPFIFTLEGAATHDVYCAPLQSEAERQLERIFLLGRGYKVNPITRLPVDADITNVSAIGPQQAIEHIAEVVDAEPHLLAFSGPAFEGEGLYWLDIHHCDASKGGAVEVLRESLNITRVICFGDSDNDLSLFDVAEESYAPVNALPIVKARASEVIGHHDEDGVARFLRERFSLKG